MTQPSPTLSLTVDNWQPAVSAAVPMQALQALEQGQLLVLPQLAFTLTTEEQQFLSPTFVIPKVKNISFNMKSGSLKGACGTATELTQITAMMARFANSACSLIHELLPHYRGNLQLARTSFRPMQISTRQLSYRKDDTRLHVDAFPATPNQGKRILRVFSNINLSGEPRVWRVGEPFSKVAQRFLPLIARPWPGSASCLQQLRITRGRRTEYDHIMLKMHNYMKKDLKYQREAMQTELYFPPGCSWIVQTDQVSHAAMSGQHVLEQTFYLPVAAMLDPNQSPLKILERLTKRILVS